ncbi:MAG: galactose oxidase early set domain-containing protein, partial [Planctomycetota bacterium]
KGWLLSRTTLGQIVAVTGQTPSPNPLFTRLDGNSIRDPFNLDRFFAIGGRDGSLTGTTPGALGRSEVYDREFRTTAPSVGWSQLLPSLNTGRVYCDTVGLPDASIVVFHGATVDSKQPPGPPAVAASRPERLVLGSGVPWQELAPEAHLRAYHGGGLLLRDGRVVSMGGQFDSPTNPNPTTGIAFQSDAQIFSPGYLFQGPQPRITSVPAQVSYGMSFSVDVMILQSDSIGSVVLISPGSVTHGIDFEQRFVPLTLQSVSAPTPVPPGWKSVTCTVLGPAQDPGTTPPASHQAPPGYYLFFVLTAPSLVAPQGVPSFGRFVRVQ